MQWAPCDDPECCTPAMTYRDGQLDAIAAMRRRITGPDRVSVSLGYVTRKLDAYEREVHEQA